MASDLTVADPVTFPTAFDHAVNTRNFARLLRLFEPEACIRKSDGSVGKGTDQISVELRNLISAKAQLRNHLRRILQSGETALIVIDWTLELDNPAGERVTTRGTATNVIRRKAEHGWRMLIANPQGAA